MFMAISALCAFLSLGLLITGVGQRRRALAARLWPTALGIIRASSVESRATGAGGHAGRGFIARVQYDYEVGGHTYHGDCISTGMPWTTTRNHPDSLVLRYAAGNVAQVHFHPDDCARSVLQIHPRGAGAGATAAALVALLSCGVALFAAARSSVAP